MENKKNSKEKKLILHIDGVTYFDRKVERSVFFILTILMLVWGAILKLT